MDGLKSTAHALLINWYMSSLDGELRSRYLFAACHHANEAARLGRGVSPAGASASAAVLFFMFYQFDKLADTVPELSYWYKDALRALTERKKKVEQGQKKVLQRRMQQPNRYRCAAVGCGIQADKGSKLQRCK